MLAHVTYGYTGSAATLQELKFNTIHMLGTEKSDGNDETLRVDRVLIEQTY